VYSALADDATLTAMADVYQTAPDNMGFPYVDIASTTESIDDTFAGTGSNGRIITVTLNIWSEQKQDDEANRIYDRIVELLNWANLSVADGWELVSINLDNTNSRLSENYRQITTRFRLRLDK
jgi:hypothetical protein